MKKVIILKNDEYELAYADGSRIICNNENGFKTMYINELQDIFYIEDICYELKDIFSFESRNLQISKRIHSIEEEQYYMNNYFAISYGERTAYVDLKTNSHAKFILLLKTKNNRDAAYYISAKEVEKLLKFWF